MRYNRVLGLALAGLVLCAAAAQAREEQKMAPLVHCVIFRMKKDAPADAVDQVIADCHKMLAKIKSVRSVRAGRPAQTGTDEKLKKPFDVGLLVLCDDVAGLKAYIDDPLHKEFVAKYGKYFDIEQLQVFDFEDAKK
jgi:stress responsive alpha/beta barrel protein